jgi:ubiquinone/menaquinone biosynthesis C-methylase UbiE
VRQYLDAEISHIQKKIDPGNLILELGCGYGRIIPQISKQGRFVIGIDTSLSSLQLAQQFLKKISNQALFQMDAVRLGFGDKTFDRVICIQNGISAFHVDPASLIKESIRVIKPGGIIWFSTYSEKFWHHRLEWFRLQSQSGLIGEIDDGKTGNGVIICKDGFRATTFGREAFEALLSGFNVNIKIEEIDSSSLICEIKVNRGAFL